MFCMITDADLYVSLGDYEDQESKVCRTINMLHGN